MATQQKYDAATIYRARSVITMDPAMPRADAVAVVGTQIIAVGTMDEVSAAIDDGEYVIDDQFSDQILVPGLIDQHLHPLLGASTLTTSVIAPEEWVLPNRTYAAASSEANYDELLSQAHASLESEVWLFSWGYHGLWHGELSRSRLDKIVGNRPTAVWQRSCHEWFLNSAAIDALGITAENMSGHGAASDMVDLERGHFWENGWMVLLSRYLMPLFLTEERFREGLAQMVEYLHMNGVTAINEPGINWAVEPWHLYEELLGGPEVPFTSTFLVDARTQSVKGLDPAAAVDDAAEQIARAPEGKVSLVPKQVKLFADGAIISQMMQMNESYLDFGGQPNPDHHGEWIMEPIDLRRFFDAYWDAGWQIHVHVNGDLGLDVLLDIIDDAQHRQPRINHRTVIVHFANSTEAQVARIAKLGAIVSANPYYPVGFADKYGEIGLGPERADVMVRSGSVLRNNIPLSFHSDLPMGPSDPMAMASFAVNRITHSGRVAAPEQRISVQAALEAVTIGAAYSWQREDDLGSIEVGKLANFTVLGEDPFGVDPERLGRITVEGTVFEGRWFPVSESSKKARANATSTFVTTSSTNGECGHGCGCEVARFIGQEFGQRTEASAS